MLSFIRKTLYYLLLCLIAVGSLLYQDSYGHELGPDFNGSDGFCGGTYPPYSPPAYAGGYYDEGYWDDPPPLCGNADPYGDDPPSPCINPGVTCGYPYRYGGGRNWEDPDINAGPSYDGGCWTRAVQAISRDIRLKNPALYKPLNAREEIESFWSEVRYRRNTPRYSYWNDPPSPYLKPGNPAPYCVTCGHPYWYGGGRNWEDPDIYDGGYWDDLPSRDGDLDLTGGGLGRICQTSLGLGRDWDYLLLGKGLDWNYPPIGLGRDDPPPGVHVRGTGGYRPKW